MTGSGAAGELTFTDLRRRLAMVAARLASATLPPGVGGTQAATVNSVPEVTLRSGDGR